VIRSESNRSSRAGSVIWWTSPRKRRSSARWATASACHVERSRPEHPRYHRHRPEVRTRSPAEDTRCPTRISTETLRPCTTSAAMTPAGGDGVIPPDLDGRLLRNGPNPAVVPTDETDYHWFAGDGMIHAISLAGGKATAIAIAGCDQGPGSQVGDTGTHRSGRTRRRQGQHPCHPPRWHHPRPGGIGISPCPVGATGPGPCP